MPAFHPGRGDLPQEIAIFPLPGALLLPEGKLPLNIFEPRYLAMVEDALGQGRMFGMVQGDPGLPRIGGDSQLYKIGCLGRVSSFAETEDGRMLITLIEAIRRDKAWNEEAARKQLLKFFEAWGFDDAATLAGRRKLSTLLFR